MATQVGDKFAWVINVPSSLGNEKCYSPSVQIGDCKWRLAASLPPSGDLSLYLELADTESLPSEWRKYVNFRLTVVRQVSVEPSVLKEAQRWYHKGSSYWGFPSMISFTKLQDNSEGFIVNGELMIFAELDFIQVIGNSKESKTNSIKVESESLTKDTTVEFRAKIQHMKTACVNVLLSLTQTLCQTPQELSFDDISEAEKTLVYMKDSGFDVSWLKKKLEEVKEKKKKEQSGLK